MSHGDRSAVRDLLLEDPYDRPAGPDHVSEAYARVRRPRRLAVRGSEQALGKHLRRAHDRRRLGGLVRTHAEYLRHARLLGRVDEVLCPDRVRLHRLVRVLLAHRDVFQRSGVDDRIDIREYPFEFGLVTHVREDEVESAGFVLVLPLHVEQRVFVVVENADPAVVLLCQEMPNDRRANRTASPRDKYPIAVLHCCRTNTSQYKCVAFLEALGRMNALINGQTPYTRLINVWKIY